MILSMTGFGAAERTWEQWAIRVEARSVNNPDLRLSIRLPDTLRLRESDIAAAARSKVSRGHLYISVTCEPTETAIGQFADKDRLRAYVRLVKAAADEEGVAVSADVGALMSLPGVLNPNALPADVREALWDNVMQTVAAALDALLELRRSEGANLGAQLLRVCGEIGEGVDEVGAGAAKCLDEYRARLAGRVKQLMEGAPSPADEDVIAREVAILAEKSDVSEEITRLRSHLKQFGTHMEADGDPVGKPLEFLAQEMLREANTMAAKLPTGEQVQQAIRIKTSVHRLREQVRNVE